MQAFLSSFFFRECAPKGKSWSQPILAESVEPGDKYGGVTNVMHKTLIECLGSINAKDGDLFRNRSVHDFYLLKALITLEQVITSVVEERRILMSKTSMVRLTGRVL